VSLKCVKKAQGFLPSNWNKSGGYMKGLFAMTIVSLCSIGCSTNELTRDKAADILKKDFPKPYEFKLYTSVPEQAKLAFDSELEEQGLITVVRVQEVADIGKPFIHFTEKAQPYLLETSEEDIRRNIQIVKIADVEFGEVTGVKSDASGKTAIVEFTTELTNLTPFAGLMPRKIKKTTANNTATFSLYDDGWRLAGRK
jgi:hypothetical protein